MKDEIQDKISFKGIIRSVQLLSGTLHEGASVILFSADFPLICQTSQIA